MGRKIELAGWEEQLRLPKEFDQLLEELHNQQGPDVFSDLGLALGWWTEPIPPGMISKVMAAIVEKDKIQAQFNRRIFRLTGLFVTVLFFAALNFLTRMGTVGELTAHLRLEVGFFLLFACLGVGISVLTVSLSVGEGVSEKRLG